MEVENFCQVSLHILNGERQGQKFPLEEGITSFGRSSRCDIQILHKSVSGHHCNFVYENGTIFVDDKNSSNGTFINGDQVTHSQVSFGDIVQIGGIRIHVESLGENLRKTVKTRTYMTEVIEDDADQVVYRKEKRDPTFISSLPALGADKIQRDIRLLHNIGKMLQENSPIEDLMGQLMEMAQNALQVERGCIFFRIQNSQGKLTSIYRSRKLPDEAFSRESFQISETVLEDSLHKSIGIVSTNTLADQRFEADSTVKKLNIHSILSVPLLGKNGNLGVIYMDTLSKVVNFRQQDLDLLSAIGRQVGLGLERMQAEVALQKVNDQLEKRVKDRTAELSKANVNLQQEVNERKKAADAQRKSEEKYRLLIENIPDIVWTSDAQGHISYISKNVQKVYGYKPKEIEKNGSTLWLGRIHHEDVDRVKENLRALFEENEKFDCEYQLQRKDGDWIWIHNRARKCYMGEDNILQVDGVFSDITQRKRTEKDLIKSNKRLEEALAELKVTQEQVIQQERLRALGQMASGIAHDFNNALSPISGFSELLMLPNTLDDRIKSLDYLRMIHTSAQDAASIVRRLREFYRHREVGEIFSPVILNKLVEEVVLLTQPKWKDQALAAGVTIKIEVDIVKEMPTILGNESELREMMTNLIFNAVDAMPESGSIILRTKTKDDRVVFQIQDNGVGMDEKTHLRCLEPFFSTKGERGTGLGLSMVFGIVKRHHGTINIDTQVNQGTTFTFSFPVEEGRSLEQKNVAMPQVIPNLRVLLVDDELPMRNLLSAYLEYNGHQVEVASNGREALEKYNENDFDVVVTDMAMPEVSGDQLAAAIKQLSPHKPIILITGFGDMMLAAGEKPKGVDFVLSKPVRLEDFRDVLARAI